MDNPSEKLDRAAAHLLQAERLIEIALRDSRSRLRFDQVGRLNSSLHFIESVREAIQYQAGENR